jgi:hypothetical protein
MEFALFTESDMFANNAIRADFAAGANFGFWVNNRGAMDHEKYFLSFRGAVKWAFVILPGA